MLSLTRGMITQLQEMALSQFAPASFGPGITSAVPRSVRTTARHNPIKKKSSTDFV